MSGSRCGFCCRRSSKDCGSEKLPAGGYGIRPYVTGGGALDDPRPCGSEKVPRADASIRPCNVGVDARHRPGSLAAAAMRTPVAVSTFPHKGRLFCCAAICTKQVRLYLYKITTKFARSSGKTAKYASKTAACAKNTPIMPKSATIGSTQKHGPAFDRCYTV